MILIFVNAAILGLETSPALMASFGGVLTALDRAILALFVAEITLRIYAYRSAFFRDPWSLFDLAVVGIALVPASGPFAVLRALRVLRVLRALTIVPSMRRVVGGLLAAIPGLSSIAMVLLLIFYVFSVITTNLFGPAFPDWFGTIGRSLYTLFQIMTLESWSMGIVRPVMEEFPYAWAFFVPFILIATFTMLNLFIGIIVSAMQSFTESEAEDLRLAQSSGGGPSQPERVTDRLPLPVRPPADHADSMLRQEITALRREIAELRAVLPRNAA